MLADAEDLFARAHAIPPRLIHADLHLDNIVFAAGGPVILDWQSASYGPALHDVVRLLSESLRGADLDEFETLAKDWRRAVVQHGGDGPDLDPAALERDLETMLDVVVAGLAGGHGGDRPSRDPAGRERAAPDVMLSERGISRLLRRRRSRPARRPRPRSPR